MISESVRDGRGRRGDDGSGDGRGRRLHVREGHRQRHPEHLPLLRPAEWVPALDNDRYHRRMATAPTTERSTRDRLVAAAIEVFVAQGYDGARVQDIARTAGLTTGAIYANYRGKADLLFDAIGALAGVELEALLEQARGREARDVLEQLGATLTRRMQHRPALLLDAIVAAATRP